MRHLESRHTVVAFGVGSRSRGRDRVSGDQNLGSGHVTSGDGIPQREHGVPARAEIAHGGEAGHERALRVHRGSQSGVRVGLSNEGRTATIPRLSGQMHVQVDEPRHHELVGKIDDGPVLAFERPHEAGTDVRNLAVTHDHSALVERRSPGNDQKCSRVHENGLRESGRAEQKCDSNPAVKHLHERSPNATEDTTKLLVGHVILRPTDEAGAEFEIESVRLVFRKEHLAGIPAWVGWQGLGDIFRETIVSRSPERIELEELEKLRGLGYCSIMRIAFDDDFRQRVHERMESFERREIVDHDLLRAAVAVVLVSNEDGDASFILTRRPLTLRRHAGQWALPGGRTDEGESVTEAALREVKEEVGLELDRDGVVGHLDDFQTRSGFVITPVVVWGPDQPELTPDPVEVQAAHIVPLEVLDAPGVPRVSISEGQTSDRPLLCFPIPLLSTTVWAPTAAMLYQTREVLLHGRSTRVAHFEQPRFAWK